MICEKELIELCEKEGFQLFKTETGLDDETDICLDTDDIGELFRLCRSYTEKCLFYHFGKDGYGTKIPLEDVYKNILEYVNESIEDNFRARELLYEDDKTLFIDKYRDEIEAKLMEYNAGENRGKIFYPYLDIFISHYGERIGICLFDQDLDKKQKDFEEFADFLEEIKVRIIQDINNLIEERETESK